jgi:hypothetical protein
MVEVFVPEYDWNSHFASLEDHTKACQEHGESEEGSEFTLVRLAVGAATTYRIVNGKPEVVAIAFPDAMAG